ncbi:hypothetical protein HDU76_004912, partial [Blyttiomyces sp. JEL0837]
IVTMSIENYLNSEYFSYSAIRRISNNVLAGLHVNKLCGGAEQLGRDFTANGFFHRFGILFANAQLPQPIASGCYNATLPTSSFNPIQITTKYDCLQTVPRDTLSRVGYQNLQNQGLGYVYCLVITDLTLFANDFVQLGRFPSLKCIPCTWEVAVTGELCGSANTQIWYFEEYNIAGTGNGGGNVPTTAVPTTNQGQGPSVTSGDTPSGTAVNNGGNGGQSSATADSTNTSPDSSASVTNGPSSNGGSPNLIPGGSSGNSNGGQGSGVGSSGGPGSTSGHDGGSANASTSSNSMVVAIGAGVVGVIVFVGVTVGLVLWRRKLAKKEDIAHSKRLRKGPLTTKRTPNDLTSTMLEPVPVVRMQDSVFRPSPSDKRVSVIPEKSGLFTVSNQLDHGSRASITSGGSLELTRSEQKKGVNVASWSYDDVQLWLSRNMFDKDVCQRFRDYRVTGLELLEMTSDFLQSYLGIRNKDVVARIVALVKLLRSEISENSFHDYALPEASDSHTSMDEEDAEESMVLVNDDGLPAYTPR